MRANHPVPLGATVGSAPSGVRLLWIGASALGSLIGAVAALTFFPSAAFGANPTGQFGWHLVGFASLIGAALGLSQWVVLRHLLKPANATDRLLLHLWIPATSLGIVAMLMPLWWRDAEVFILLPWMSAGPMIPGIVLLGILQQLILRRLISIRLHWIPPTLIGVTIGSTLGLIAVIGVALFTIENRIAIQFSIDLAWSSVTGIFLGLFQARALAANLPTGRRHEDLRP